MNNNKWMHGNKRILSLALTAGLTLTLSQPVVAMDSGIPAENEAVTATALSVEGDTAASDISDNGGAASDIPENGYTAVSDTTAPGGTDTSDLSVINDPRTKTEGNTTYSTWDCIWFGNYWQEDTNGDGKCYAEETIDEGTTYPADEKQPIKWRVLDIDESGNALLLADKLIDIVQYNEEFTDVTWETCTMRSYLNGYDGSNNDCKKDFSGDKSFIYNAFSEAERDSIIISDLKNPDNPIFETKGGDNTQDKIFCLSLDEARKADYGFVKNEFTYGEPKTILYRR